MKKLRITVNGVSYDVEVEVLEDEDLGGISYGFPGATFPSDEGPREGLGPPPPTAKPSPPKAMAGAKELASPIAGTLVEVKVSEGDVIQANDVMVVIEAMKMNTSVRSTGPGKVKEIKVKSGDSVQQGQVLIVFE